MDLMDSQPQNRILSAGDYLTGTANIQRELKSVALRKKQKIGPQTVFTNLAGQTQIDKV